MQSSSNDKSCTTSAVRLSVLYYICEQNLNNKNGLLYICGVSSYKIKENIHKEDERHEKNDLCTLFLQSWLHAGRIDLRRPGR